MSRLKTSPAIVTLCGLLTLCADASDPPSPSLTIHKTTRLVQVDVVVRDNHGRPVTGLRQSDFVVKDEGRVQPITGFVVEHAPATAPPAPTPDPSTANKHTASQRKVPKFTNVHATSAIASVILLDLLNTPSDAQPIARRKLISAFQDRKTIGPTAVLILTQDLTLVTDFNTSTISLANRVAGVSTPGGEGLGPPITAPRTPSAISNALILKASISAMNLEKVNRTELTVRALSFIREQLARFAGRKSLIWITGGINIPISKMPSLKESVDRFNDDNIGIYTVDARGVRTDRIQDASQDTNDQLLDFNIADDESRGDVLDWVALETGGLAFKNTNALDSAIAQAFDDSLEVYSLWFAPSATEWNGKFHKLQVTVKRPGTHVRTRDGYFATPEPPISAAQQEANLRAIAASPVETPGIRFEATVRRNQQDSSAATLLLTIHAADIAFSRDAEQSLGSVQVWCLQHARTGEQVATSTATYPLTYAGSDYYRMLSQGLKIGAVIKLEHSAASVRVVLRDSSSGRVGTLDVPLDTAN